MTLVVCGNKTALVKLTLYQGKILILKAVVSALLAVIVPFLTVALQ
jgi:hypothetical protein